jgi:hypothetical protein
VGELEEGVRAQVEEGPPVDTVREHEHDPQRDLVGDDVPHGPARETHHRRDRGVAKVEDEPDAGTGTGERRRERERDRRQPGGRAQPEQQDEPGVAPHLLERDRLVGDAR